MEELSRATINEWWEAHEKPDDYILTRGEYKELDAPQALHSSWQVQCFYWHSPECST